MIIKPLEVSGLILQTEALNRRLPISHTKKEIVKRDARNLRSGYKGELSLDFPLSFLSHQKYLIFHNLRIPDPNGYFQIDILILSTNFIVIVEVKNIFGEVLFDGMGQVIRKTEEIEEGFANPIDQVNLQHFRLLQWLRQFDFPPIPLEKVVVYSNPNTVLKNVTNDKIVAETVIHKEKLRTKIEEFSNMHITACFNEKQLKELTFQLISSNTPAKANVMEKYQIDKGELVKGVICPDCSHIPMLYKSGKWLCNYCDGLSRVAHRYTLIDYNLLINNYINNREARDFLLLESDSITRKLLQKEKLDQFGTTSGRRYKLSLEKLKI